MKQKTKPTFTTKLKPNDALKIELKTASICYDMEQNGFPLDVEETNKQIGQLQERVDWVDTAVIALIPPKPVQYGTTVTKIFKMNGDYTKQVLDWFPERNSAKCLMCQDEIVSTHGHDFVTCSCGNISIDGGNEYHRRSFKTEKWRNTSSTPENVEGSFCRIAYKPINLGSPVQVNKWLLDNGWVPTEWNCKKVNGKDVKDQYGNKIKTSPKITDDSLGSLEALGPAGRMIAYRRKCAHKRNQLQGFLRNLRPDGCVPSKVNTLGAATRRMTHSIIANVPTPKEGQFWKPMRKVFCAGDPDWVVVGADASQIQIRGLVHYAAVVANDYSGIDAIERADRGEIKDYHTANGEAAGVSRNASKNIFYGYLFGAGIPKTASQLEVSVKEAQKIRAKFAKAVPYVDQIVEHLTMYYRIHGYITGLDGTKIYAESEHMLLVYLLQNFEAVFMKVALCYTMDRIKKQGLRAKFVTMQHDEFQFIAHKDDADKLAKILEKSMVDAGKFVGSKCPVLGEAKIGNSWFSTH